MRKQLVSESCAQKDWLLGLRQSSAPTATQRRCWGKGVGPCVAGEAHEDDLLEVRDVRHDHLEHASRFAGVAALLELRELLALDVEGLVVLDAVGLLRVDVDPERLVLRRAPREEHRRQRRVRRRRRGILDVGVAARVAQHEGEGAGAGGALAELGQEGVDLGGGLRLERAAHRLPLLQVVDVLREQALQRRDDGLGLRGAGDLEVELRDDDGRAVGLDHLAVERLLALHLELVAAALLLVVRDLQLGVLVAAVIAAEARDDDLLEVRDDGGQERGEAVLLALRAHAHGLDDAVVAPHHAVLIRRRRQLVGSAADRLILDGSVWGGVARLRQRDLRLRLGLDGLGHPTLLCSAKAASCCPAALLSKRCEPEPNKPLAFIANCDSVCREP